MNPEKIYDKNNSPETVLIVNKDFKVSKKMKYK